MQIALIRIAFAVTIYLKCWLHSVCVCVWMRSIMILGIASCPVKEKNLIRIERNNATIKNNRSQILLKIGVSENFAKFTRKHLCQIHFFNEVVGIQDATALKKRLSYSFFSLNFAKYIKTPICRESTNDCFCFQ